MPYLAGFVTPQDYGAVGDGTTDDTAAVQAAFTAITAAGGGTLLVPKGTYLLSSTITSTGNVSVMGLGPAVSIFQQSNTAANAITYNPTTALSGVSVSEVGFTGPGSGTGVGLLLEANTGALQVNGCVVSNVVVTGFGSHAVSAVNAVGCSFNSIFASSIGGNLLSLTGGSTASNSVNGCSGGTVTTTGTVTTSASVNAATRMLVGATTALGDNGAGELQLANATTAPTTNPTGGVTIYGANGTSALQRDTAGHLTNLSWSDQAYQFNGLTAQNMDTNFATSANLCVSGTINLHKIYVPTTVTTTNVIVYVTTAGSTLTAGQNLIGLYDSGGTRRAVTADQTTNWGSTGVKNVTWSSSYAIPSPGVYYVAILSVGTTPVTLAGSPGFSTLYNVNTTGATLVHADGPTAQTSMPASITMSSNTSSAKSIFVAII